MTRITLDRQLQICIVRKMEIQAELILHIMLVLFTSLMLSLLIKYQWFCVKLKKLQFIFKHLKTLLLVYIVLIYT